MKREIQVTGDIETTGNELRFTRGIPLRDLPYDIKNAKVTIEWEETDEKNKG